MITFRVGNLSRMCFVYCLFGLEIPRNYLAHTHTWLTTLPPSPLVWKSTLARIQSKPTGPFMELSGFEGRNALKCSSPDLAASLLSIDSRLC